MAVKTTKIRTFARVDSELRKIYLPCSNHLLTIKCDTEKLGGKSHLFSNRNHRLHEWMCLIAGGIVDSATAPWDQQESMSPEIESQNKKEIVAKSPYPQNLLIWRYLRQVLWKMLLNWQGFHNRQDQIRL